MNIFSGKWKKNKQSKGLGGLSYDELRLEKVKLESSEQKALRDLQELEDQKTILFEEAKRSPLSVQQVKARQIRDISNRVQILQGNMQRVGKLIQIVDLTMAHKELGNNSPFGEIIQQTDSLELENWVDDIVTTSTVADQKLDQILKSFGEAQISRTGVATGDSEIDAILAEIQMAVATDAITTETNLAKNQENKPAEKER